MVDMREIITMLPFDTISLNDLSSFDNSGENWKIAGLVTSDYEKEHELSIEPGSGILVNDPQTDDNKNIRTTWKHGDLELKFEVMMPKGSNSGVYLQGRYEVQLFDSWGKEKSEHSDMGGIYQRWDENRPDGQKGYEGVPPELNASLAPGLWQRYHLLFRAPRFDSSGKKMSNARFEFVYLNDQLIHKDVEVSGPTRAFHEEGETSEGPLYIQGDHGPVAFRNIEYKRYGLDTLALQNITYKVYAGKYDYIPDFDTMSPVSSGNADFFNLEVADKQEGFAIVFNGKLDVPVEGNYLFETQIDDGGDLVIDSQLVVHNEGEPGWGAERGLVRLTQGIHDIEMTFYQEVWSARLLVFYEGPGISRRPLGTFQKKEPWQLEMEKQAPLVIDELEETEFVRSFVMYGDEKLTHAISVGDHNGINYSYDLNAGAIVKCWKGALGDVTDMWRGRGESQILQPLSPFVLLPRSFPVSDTKASEQFLQYHGYSIDQDRQPVFHYQLNGMEFDDKIVSEDGHLIRKIQIDKKPEEGYLVNLGEAPKIIQLTNGLYSFDGQYYLSTQGLDWKIRHEENKDVLVADLNSNNISYKLIW